MEFIELTNYEKLLQTANTFAGSQGTYARMFHELVNCTDEEKDNINSIESLKNCKDTLDVIMLLEG